MEKFSSTLIRNIIVAVVSVSSVGSGVGVLVSGAISLASGSPIKSVVKDTVVDEVKLSAMNYLYGADEQSVSLADIVGSRKYSTVSDKKQGIFQYWKHDYYSEAYLYDGSVFIGDRQHNKPNSVNLAWNVVDCASFELGNYKKGNLRDGSYIAYDGMSASFVIGQLKKTKLTGYCLVYDEYNNVYSFDYYKKGKKKGSMAFDDSGVLSYTKSNGKVVAYDFLSGEFDKAVDGDVVVTDLDDGRYKFILDGRSYLIDTADNYIVYEADDCDFSGSPYKFDCTYQIGDEWVTYNYLVYTNVTLTQSDGTYGEVKVVSDSDDAYTLGTEILVEFGLHTFIDTCVETAISGNPYLIAANEFLRLTTGKGAEDRINDFVDDLIENKDVDLDEIKGDVEKSEVKESRDFYTDENGTFTYSESGMKIYMDTDSNKDKLEEDSSEWYMYNENGLKIHY